MRRPTRFNLGKAEGGSERHAPAIAGYAMDVRQGKKMGQTGTLCRGGTERQQTPAREGGGQGGEAVVLIEPGKGEGRGLFKRGKT